MIFKIKSYHWLNISLSLPNLPKIVHEFVNKGYTLADDFLLKGDTSISNLDLILGSRAAYNPVY